MSRQTLKRSPEHRCVLIRSRIRELWLNRRAVMDLFGGLTAPIHTSPLSRLKFWLLRSISSALRCCVCRSFPSPLPTPHSAPALSSLPWRGVCLTLPPGRATAERLQPLTLQPVHARSAWKASRSRATHCVVCTPSLRIPQ